MSHREKISMATGLQSLMVLSVLALAGCSPTPKLIGGQGNPAADYCVQVGGKSEIKTLPDGGQAGDCALPDGRVVDEWKLFRETHGH